MKNLEAQAVTSKVLFILPIQLNNANSTHAPPWYPPPHQKSTSVWKSHRALFYFIVLGNVSTLKEAIRSLMTIVLDTLSNITQRDRSTNREPTKTLNPRTHKSLFTHKRIMAWKHFATYLSAQPEQKEQGSVQVLVFPCKIQLYAQQQHL